MAAEQLGRGWIGVDIGELAIATIKHRLEKGSVRLSQLKSGKKADSEKADTASLFDNPDFMDITGNEEKEESGTVEYDFFEAI